MEENNNMAEVVKNNKTGRNLPRKKILMLVVAAGLLVVVIIWLMVRNNQPAGAGHVATIHIKNGEFVPATLSVKQGTKVTWIDDDDDITYKIAANPYPTHSSLPSLVSGNLQENDQYSFVFDKNGTYGYHNDNKPTMNGTVIVQ